MASLLQRSAARVSLRANVAPRFAYAQRAQAPVRGFAQQGIKFKEAGPARMKPEDVPHGRNAVTGLSVFAFCGAVYYYTISRMKSSAPNFDEIIEEVENDK